MRQRLFFSHAAAAAASFAPAGDNPRAFWKPAIRLGHFKHPQGKFELDIDAPRLEEMGATLSRMLEAGITIPVTQDHQSDAQHMLGRITDVEIRGEWLWLKHEFADDDAVQLAKRVDGISIELERQFVDGLGRTWSDAIVASSIVPNPLVPGQGSFSERIAASAGSGGEPAPVVWAGPNSTSGPGSSGGAATGDPIQEAIDRMNSTGDPGNIVI